MTMTFKETERSAPHNDTDMDDVRQATDEAIRALVARVNDLAARHSDEAAEAVCLASRSAVQLFCLAHGEFGEDATPLRDELVRTLARAEELCHSVAGAPGSASPVRKYLENIASRRRLLDAVLSNDVQRLRTSIRQELALL